MRYGACSQTVVPLEVLSQNLRSAIARRIPSVTVGPPLPHAIAVVAGGPSVKEDLQTLKEWKGYIAAINGAHDWLLDNGITPDAMIALDPEASMTRYFQRATDTTTYLIASCCDPAVFDALAGKRVILWHVMQGDQYPNGANMCVWGGPTAATRAPHLLHLIGYRDIHVFGVDSCISAQTHAYANNEGIRGDHVNVRVGDEVYVSTMGFVMQAEALWEVVKRAPEDTKVTVHGYGLGPAVVKNKGEFEVF